MPQARGPDAAFTVVIQQPRPGVRLLLASGDLDIATAPRLRAAVLPAPGDERALVLDLGAVTFLAAAGLRALLECQQNLDTVVLVRAEHDPVRLPLVLTGLDAVLPRYPSVDAALAALA